MSAIDWRGLCEELLVSLENEGYAHWPEGPDGDPLIDRARLALAQPEPEVVGPSVEELDDLFNEIDQSWGRPAPAPAGEVAELVQPPGRAGLTWQGVIEGLRDVLNDESEDAIQRVWQRSRILDAISVMEANPCPAPVPVAVSERPWEREGWCDSEGRCWWFNPEDPHWVFDDAMTCRHWADFLLPHNALPLPQGEAG